MTFTQKKIQEFRELYRELHPTIDWDNAAYPTVPEANLEQFIKEALEEQQRESLQHGYKKGKDDGIELTKDIIRRFKANRIQKQADAQITEELPKYKRYDKSTDKRYTDGWNACLDWITKGKYYAIR